MPKLTVENPFKVVTHKGRREITYYDLPRELSSEQIFEATKNWVNREIASRGMICEIKYVTNEEAGDQIELWCTTRRIVGDDFGEIVKEWGTPKFLRQLHDSFQETMKKAIKQNKKQ
ncbi:MobA/MobL family protein [Xenococcus sp. PCC 7305]|uniref:hypothetical protein n=1 Tax=Xenococcus sp. PCC 7305 TaxID=102125 RepID=UPI0002AC34F4|nr:hypothetical protein [Xenococcus sp. PCC 7305]ELS02702.1 MobA/MobL family protein [Xenococcus sp. PCC 7305]